MNDKNRLNMEMKGTEPFLSWSVEYQQILLNKISTITT